MADTLGGSVERIVYSNPENGYTVLRLRPSSEVPTGVLRGGVVTVVGTFPEISGGEKLVLKGTWVTHSTHGTQFQADEFQQQMPTTVAGIRRYLGSGLIKGIGERLAERIVDHFGAETINIIESRPDRLLEVTDIGAKRAQMITEAWEEQKNIKQIMLFLHSQKISTSLAVKIYKHYGDDALQVVRNDPYRMATDIRGIGFKTADQVARKIGLPADHPSRIEAGVLYALDQSSNDGNVFYPKDLLTNSALQLLNVPEDHIKPAIQRLINQEQIHLETVPISTQQMYPGTDRFNERAKPIEASFPERARHVQVLYPIQLYYSELGTARNLAALASAFPTRLSDVPPGFVSLDPALSDEQKDAVKSSLSNPVSVLTGGPGTGKTTTIRALISALESAGKTFALASPTGRAAKRLSQATGQPASTIHRLLAYSPGEGFRNNAKNPIDLDMLVIDEVSMLDIVLANHLLKALKPGTHLLLVGDSDQLPSVGPGDVLRDIIASGIAKVNRLSKIFRQAENSYIITNAHRINAGQLPVFPSIKQEGDQQPVDFFLFPSDTPEEAASWIVDVVCNRIPREFKLDSATDIQVLSPMYRGAAGVDALNSLLQSRLNPKEPKGKEHVIASTSYRVRDKLMQIRNNYDKNVFNGDIGFLVDVDKIEQTFTVEIDGIKLVYDFNEIDQLVHAYAITVHKSQGSEFPAIVIPMITQHYVMLQRNLLYTAITRAKGLCVLVGNRKAISLAVRNNKVADRFSGLEYRLLNL